jgi:16S rRNA (guanine966-N2)-methyltransferase
VVEQNIRTLGVEDRAMLLVTSAFVWAKRDLPNVTAPEPWLVFCSPPYAFYRERQAEMAELIGRIQSQAPAGTILVVEAEEPFDFNLLGDANTSIDVEWDVRAYPPAIVGLWRASSASP